VAGPRSHPIQRGDEIGVQRHAAADADTALQLEVASKLSTEALALVGVHADGCAHRQLAQMIGRRSDEQQASIGPQHAMHLYGVARGEGHDDHVNRMAADGQACPYVCADRSEPRVAARRGGESVAGDVDRHAVTVAQAVQDPFGVMAGACAYVEQPRRRTRSARLCRDGRERGRHCPKAARLEEETASLDHVAVVPRVPDAPATDVESHAATARDVETMPELAHEAAFVGTKTPAAVWTREYRRRAEKRRRRTVRTTGRGRTSTRTSGRHGNTSRVGPAPGEAWSRFRRRLKSRPGPD
jgi:hypothetical protein